MMIENRWGSRIFHRIRKKFAFTLMEVMIVVIAIGLIAVYVLPNYNESIRRARERDAILQLTLLRGANYIYEARNGSYWEPVAEFPDMLAVINTNLKINIIPSGLRYTYTFTASGFDALAIWDDEDDSKDFTVRIRESEISSGNPCCTSLRCPTLPCCADIVC